MANVYVEAPSGSALSLAGRAPLTCGRACSCLTGGIRTRVIGPEAISTGGILALDAAAVDIVCTFYLDHASVAEEKNVPIAVCLGESVILRP
jgi:hypothetical protein